MIRVQPVASFSRDVDGLPALATKRLELRVPSGEADAGRLRAYAERNVSHFAPWSPSRGADYLSRAFWDAQVASMRQATVDGKAMHWVLSAKGDPEGEILGEINATNIVRGVFQACYLGYNLDRRAEGRGYMSEALTLAIGHLFAVQGLHRIQANVMPNNARSIALLQRLGFSREGFAKDYLYLAGAWQDHVLYSLVNHTLAKPRPFAGYSEQDVFETSTRTGMMPDVNKGE